MKSLEQSRERLQMAMDAAKIYSWELNPSNYQSEWSNNFEQVVGIFALARFRNQFQ
jgi:hypothetical protein